MNKSHYFCSLYNPTYSLLFTHVIIWFTAMTLTHLFNCIACDVMTPSIVPSPQDSHYTTESVNKEEQPMESLSPLPNEDLVVTERECEIKNNFDVQVILFRKAD